MRNDVSPEIIIRGSLPSTRRVDFDDLSPATTPVVDASHRSAEGVNAGSVPRQADAQTKDEAGGKRRRNCEGREEAQERNMKNGKARENGDWFRRERTKEVKGRKGDGGFAES